MAGNGLASELRVILVRERARIVILAALAVLLLTAANSMSASDWVITLLRGLSVGAVTFLVASGFSLIFGLMDVLNLAQGTLFMIGAYIGWTFYVRPDTFVDLLTPLAMLAAGMILMPVWNHVLGRVAPSATGRAALVWPWIGLMLAAAILFAAVPRYTVAMWDLKNYTASPVTFSLMLDQGVLRLPDHPAASPVDLLVGLGGALIGSTLVAASVAGWSRYRGHAAPASGKLPWRTVIAAAVVALAGLGVYAVNQPLTQALVGLSTTWRFALCIVAATLGGMALGGLMEATLIRPLYARPIYQLMLTLGLAVIGREVVIAIWGRTQITMTAPALFAASGKGCPAANLSDWLVKQCSTISFMGGRIRTYNEIFIILVGVIVLAAVWLLLQRSRLGMIIRAGVQDRQMVEALGINVRRVFTFVFALGVGLAALGGVLAGPAFGVSDAMGEELLLKALIALAIGGLTSFPGAAAGSVLVGVLEQFIVKYGQIGIQLPFVALVFKPSPPIVPASTVLLMVIVLLALPQGLFGRKE